jgi:tetratricopeptide (TPR) repeat protein
MSQRPPSQRHDKTTDIGRALQILRQLAAMPEHEHAACLQRACGGDDELRRQVERLLAPTQERPTAARRTGRFGRYTLLDFVGEGAMGVVYRAEQDHPQRQVALKLLHPGPVSAAICQRFEREATVLASLHHPGIAQVLDAGIATTENGPEPFLAMEFVDGEPLLTAAALLPLAARLELLIELCLAVDHAHGRGVIHRDLKPDNLLVESSPQGLHVRVLDFGVAMAADTGIADGNQTVGTLAYMSPEQLDGPVDVRGDVYSLGAIGYQMLGGRLPVDVDSLSLPAALTAIRTQLPKPLADVDRRLRGDLDAILQRALAKDPAARYPSARALADDLQRHLDHKPISARPHTPLYLLARFARRRRALAAGLLIAGFSLASGMAMTVSAMRRTHTLVEQLSSLTADVLGDVGPYLDEAAGASAALRELLPDLEHRLEPMLLDRPQDHQLRRVAADVLRYRGNLARDAARFDEALDLRRRHLDARLALAADAPDDADLRRDLAIAQVLLGDVWVQRERLEPAEAIYQQAHAIFVELAAAAVVLPDRLDERQRRALDDLACSHARLGEKAQLRRDLAAARRHLDALGQLARRLAADFPAHSATQALLRSWHSIESGYADELGDQQERRRHLDLAWQHARELAAAHPNHASYLEQSLASAAMLAAVMRAQGDLENTKAVLDLALATARPLLDSPDYLPGLCTVFWARRDSGRALGTALVVVEHECGSHRGAMLRGQSIALLQRALSGFDPAVVVDDVRQSVLRELHRAVARSDADARDAACLGCALAAFGDGDELAEADARLTAAAAGGLADVNLALGRARLHRKKGERQFASAALQQATSLCDPADALLLHNIDRELLLLGR